MDKNQINIKIRDFRAIKSAEIILDGITLVAGENGSGKSSLSKLLYYVFKTANQFDSIVKIELRDKLEQITMPVTSLQREVNEFIRGYNDASVRLSQKTLKFFGPEKLIPLDINRDLQEQEENILTSISILNSSIINEIKKNDSVLKDKIRRFENILRDVLSDKDEVITGTLPEILNILHNRIEKYFNEAYEKLEKRPVNLFYNSVREAFPRSGLPKRLEVSEFGITIIGDTDSISKPYIIQNVAYIDTPMSLGVDSLENQHWEDLNKILGKLAKTNNIAINKVIQTQILNGDISLSEDKLPYTHERFIFKRADGTTFDLLDCATGVKAFAILQLLLKSGFLNNKTLLIIDEPEAHLHPQWIIEYARLIVLLNKEIGVKFFIASHNPDMVSAIKYIAERENTLDKVNFYLSEKELDSFSYNFKHLGTDIEEIFASFNIAIDRINIYGATT